MTEEIGSARGDKFKEFTYQDLTRDEPFKLTDHNEFINKLLLETKNIEERFLKIKNE